MQIDYCSSPDQSPSHPHVSPQFALQLSTTKKLIEDLQRAVSWAETGRDPTGSIAH
ncbi:hypothetical protein K6Y78_13205 [Burkholderia cenocepacia]|nr:hypothetical protein [Burkholderia cenocepacia]MCW3629598.1 hypothetical protein [Burkholderia cenocepacia]